MKVICNKSIEFSGTSAECLNTPIHFHEFNKLFISCLFVNYPFWFRTSTSYLRLYTKLLHCSVWHGGQRFIPIFQRILLIIVAGFVVGISFLSCSMTLCSLYLYCESLYALYYNNGSILRFLRKRSIFYESKLAF